MIDDFYSRRIHTTLRNIKAPRQDLHFAQLRICNQEKEFELNDQFLNSLELYTEDRKFNYAGYLLANENVVSMKLNNQKEEILRLTKSNPTVIKGNVVRHLGVFIAIVERNFDNLKKKNLIERKGSCGS